MTSRFSLLMHQRVGLCQHPVKLRERLRVRRALVVQGDRLAAHRRGQVLGDLLVIDRDPLDRFHRALPPLENEGAHHHKQRGDDQKGQDKVKQGD